MSKSEPPFEPNNVSESDLLKSDPENAQEKSDTRRDSKSAKWANERLDELLGYGRYQKFQAWVFIGLVSFVGKGTKIIG